MTDQELFDLFVTHGVTAATIAQMDLVTLERQIGELRAMEHSHDYGYPDPEYGGEESLTDCQIAKAILRHAQGDAQPMTKPYTDSEIDVRAARETDADNLDAPTVYQPDVQPKRFSNCADQYAAVVAAL